MKRFVLLMILAVLALLPPPVAAEEAFDYTWFETAFVDNGLDGDLTAIDGQDRIDLRVGNGDGMALRASLAVHPNVHLFAGYEGTNLDVDAVYSVPYPTLEQMRSAFFSTPDADHWDGLCDLNDDGMINVVDMGLMKAAGERRVLDTAAADGDMENWRFGIGYNRMLTPQISGYAQLFWDSRDLDFERVVLAGEDADIDANDNGFGATLGARGKVGERLELRANVTWTPVGDVDLLARSDADRLSADTLAGLGAQYWFTDRFSVSAGIEGDGDVQAWTLGARYGWNGLR